MMPAATISGVTLNYEVLGDDGPWVVLIPGGRRELDGMRVLGAGLAEAGYRVLLHDRRNCGASDVVIGGDGSEQEIWADDAVELARHVGAERAYFGGSSAGCRVSLLVALRHPEAVEGLLLFWVTGGHHAAESLGRNYYTQFIELAEQGGMAAVCASPFFAARIEQQPANGERLMALDPAVFIEVMARWRQFFTDGADLPVIGATEEQLRGIDVPTCIVPGNDQTHPYHVGERLHGILPDSEIHALYDDAGWESRENAPLDERGLDTQRRLIPICTDFLSRVTAVASPTA